MTNKTNFVGLPKLPDHEDVVNIFTKQHHEFGYMPESSYRDLQESLIDTLAVREGCTTYLLDCINNGKHEYVWCALQEIAIYDPFASFHISLRIRNSLVDGDVKNRTTEFIINLVNQYDVLQNNDEIFIPLLDAEFAHVRPLLKPMEAQRNTQAVYCEIGEKAIALAQDTNEDNTAKYNTVSMLLDKITTDDIRAHYSIIIGQIYGERALVYAKQGDDITAYAIASVIPATAIKIEYYNRLLQKQYL